MPAFLEQKLKAEYGADSSIPYKVMNKLGAMHGNKETAKGRAMQAKHERDMGGKKRSLRDLARFSHGSSGQHPHRNLGKYIHPKGGY